MWCALFAVAALHPFGGITGCAALARHLEAVQAHSAFSDADYARYRGTGSLPRTSSR